MPKRKHGCADEAFGNYVAARKKWITRSEWIALLNLTAIGETCVDDLLRIVAEYVIAHVFERPDGQDALEGVGDDGQTCFVPRNVVNEAPHWLCYKSRCPIAGSFSVYVHRAVETQTSSGWPIGVAVTNGETTLCLYSDNDFVSSLTPYSTQDDDDVDVESSQLPQWTAGTIVTAKICRKGKGLKFTVNGTHSPIFDLPAPKSPTEKWFPLIWIRKGFFAHFTTDNQISYTNSISFISENMI